MSNDSTLERRDVSDLETNDEVQDAVDDLLDTEEYAEEDASETASEIVDATDDVDSDSFDFSAQEWTLNEKQEPEVYELNGMKFLFEEPDDDAVLNELDQVADGDRSAQMKALVQITVGKPKITDDRWNQMSFAAKLSLAGEAAEFLGLGGGFLNE